MNKKKQSKGANAKSGLKQNKRMRRRWITFVRMCRYGVNNFSRNAWLTAAATAVMTITLLIVFATLSARSILTSTIDEMVKSQVDVSIYLKSDTEKDEAETLKKRLEKQSNVLSVDYVSSNDARQIYIDENNPSKEQLEVISELTDERNPFPASLKIVVKDLNNMSGIKKLVESDSDFQSTIDPNNEPSFEGKQAIIQTIGGWINFSERVGLIATVIFISISVLIIFNTIRMAIFNRKEEIEMMKLIGADKNFIRGPFTVEAMMYGFIAAIIAFALGLAGIFGIKQKLVDYGIAVQPTIDAIITHSPFVIIGLILLGCFIGVISSFFAVRRYLKV